MSAMDLNISVCTSSHLKVSIQPDKLCSFILCYGSNIHIYNIQGLTELFENSEVSELSDSLVFYLYDLQDAPTESFLGLYLSDDS